ncbi:MAG: hypothetical protein AB7I68_14340, partial [Porticoccaceae bacterium]
GIGLHLAIGKRFRLAHRVSDRKDSILDLRAPGLEEVNSPDDAECNRECARANVARHDDLPC